MRNHYYRAIRSFCCWLVKDRRIAENPIAHLSTLKPDKDRRHLRRVLSPDEMAALIDTTRSGPPRRHLQGEDRTMLYLTAAYTGLRASEMASLRHVSFDLSSEPNTVRVDAKLTKPGEEAVFPPNSDVARSLKAWMDRKPSDGLLWLGKCAKHCAAGKMFTADLKITGVQYQDASGRCADFHALRHSFISNLARVSAHPNIEPTLARHKSSTRP